MKKCKYKPGVKCFIRDFSHGSTRVFVLQLHMHYSWTFGPINRPIESHSGETFSQGPSGPKI